MTPYDRVGEPRRTNRRAIFRKIRLSRRGKSTVGANERTNITIEDICPELCVVIEENAVSLFNICGQSFDREELINLLLQKVEGRYFQLQKGDIKSLRKDYIDNLYWKNEIHVFQSEGTFFNGRIFRNFIY